MRLVRDPIPTIFRLAARQPEFTVGVLGKPAPASDDRYATSYFAPNPRHAQQLSVLMEHTDKLR